MTYKEFFSNLFNKVGLPVVVGSFDDDEKPVYPFIEYHRDAPTITYADNYVIQKTDNWEFSLYSKKKEAHKYWELVDSIEDILNASRIAYGRSEDIFVDDVIYTTFSLALAC